MIRSPSSLILLLLLSLLQACSTTQVQESWRLPGYQPPRPQKLLVVALTATESTRKLVESSFVRALEEKGITAIPSSNWIADGTKITRDSLVPIVEQNGITTVLVSSMREVQRSAAYQPNPGDDSDGLFRNIDTYYAYSSDGQHEGGSYAQVTEYLIETNLFAANNRKLSWSVITRTAAPKDLAKSVESITQTVMSQAEKDKAL
ncbi:MAG TPA: hypothetical protein VM553_11505 [Dongiaceae bacterium]|nr:hypothetical protein [Dongiaceae bacterium]